MIRDVVLVWALVFVTAGIVAFLVIGTSDSGDGGPSVRTVPEAEQEQATAAGETPTGGGLTFEIKMIPTIQFDRSELSIPANEDATVTADNTDEGILHNFAVYNSRDEAEGGGDAIAATEECTAPCTESTTLNLPPAEYFFRCDFHPQQMVGTLVVQ